MNFSQEDIERIVHQFDSYIKKVIRNFARDLNRGKVKQAKMEVLFSEISDNFLNSLIATEKPMCSTTFNIFHTKIEIENEELSYQLVKLSNIKRQIILLYYCIGLNDCEISEELDIAYENVKKIRNRAIDEMQKNWRND